MQATAGLLADGRHLANRARDEAQNLRDTYRSPPTLKVSVHLIGHMQPFVSFFKVCVRPSRALRPGVHIILVSPAIRN